MNWLVVLLAQPQKLNSMWDDELSASLKELTGSEVPTLLLVKSLSNIYLLCHLKYFLAKICSLIFFHFWLYVATILLSTAPIRIQILLCLFAVFA